MSDPKVVFYRYRSSRGWLAKGNPYGFEYVQLTLPGVEPDPYPIEELCYRNGTWILRSRRGSGETQERTISHDHAKLWVEKYKDNDRVNSTNNSTNEKEILSQFRSKNRAIWTKSPTNKRSGYFYPHDWEIILSYREEWGNGKLRNCFLFESAEYPDLIASVDQYLKIDRRFAEKKIVPSNNVFEIDFFPREELKGFGTNKTLWTLDAKRRVYISEELSGITTTKNQEGFRQFLNIAIDRFYKGRGELIKQPSTDPLPRVDVKANSTKRRTKEAIQREKDYLYLLGQYEKWQDESKEQTGRKRLGPKDWLSDYKRWTSKSQSLFDKYSERRTDKPLNKADEESIVGIIKYAQRLRKKTL
jgi:hypothetical protein